MPKKKKAKKASKAKKVTKKVDKKKAKGKKVVRIKKPVWGSRQGSRISNRDAEIIGPILNSLPEGKKTAKNIVDIARSDASNLHPYFEWDDSVGGEKYRMEQARYMMRSVILVGIHGSKGLIEPRAFHAVTFYDESDEEEAHVPPLKSYEPLDIIQTTPEYMGQIREAATKDIRKFKHKYATLLDVGHAVDEIIGILQNVQERGQTGTI